MTLEMALANISNPAERERYRRLVVDDNTRRGFNFSNVRKIKTKELMELSFSRFVKLWLINCAIRIQNFLNKNLQKHYQKHLRHQMNLQLGKYLSKL